ncbi:ABC transporter permease [Pollutibacter soli]|uniref:ABC transporter permease n=1 Tax=Pollutibacter soli TaxID=3034157 RepID=UPI003013D078
MRTLRFLLQKEFRQIFRNTTILRMIIMVPIIQLLILPLAADYEIKNINVAIVDHDHSGMVQQLIGKISSSGYFHIADYNSSYDKTFTKFENDKADLILEIPQHFERNLVREDKQELFLAVNAINGIKATVGSSYLAGVIRDFNADLRLRYYPSLATANNPVIDVAPVNWYNPFLNYRFFMVPGILVVLVTMVGSYMCALNIVKEKEAGTIEQINVTPIKKFQFILGKLIPFWLIGIFVFSLGLWVIARFVYGIIPVGSILLLYSFLAVYLIALLGIGLLISTYSTTQQQAMSLAFFMVMIFMLMSGLFTPIDSMPGWAKWIAHASPVTYFIDVIRMVTLKGSGLTDIKNHFLIMGGFAVFFNGWAVLNYRKTS